MNTVVQQKQGLTGQQCDAKLCSACGCHINWRWQVSRSRDYRVASSDQSKQSEHDITA